MTHSHNSLVIILFSDSAEAGVPYNVQIFAENSAGNGTRCNFTDFTNELRKFRLHADIFRHILRHVFKNSDVV